VLDGRGEVVKMLTADEKKNYEEQQSFIKALQQGPMPRDWCLDAENAW
jgi:hypothetical protein